MNVRKHPPERRRRGVILAAHGCCCCCCCCLHSVCGLIGSAVAGTSARTEEARRTRKIYWLLFLGSVAVGIAGILLETSRSPGMPSGEKMFVLASLVGLGLPLAQFNASFLTLCASMKWAIDLKMLGQITWKGFLWAFIGAMIMIVPLVLFSYLS